MEMQMQMQMQTEDGVVVKARLNLGSEKHYVQGCKGNGIASVSEQLVFVKGESMRIFKEFITKHNDVPDEISSQDDDDDDVPDEISSQDDDDDDSQVKSKKIRRENN